jgi:hypothetical protein
MEAQLKTAPKPVSVTPSSRAPALSGILKRKCACGSSTSSLGGECSECMSEKHFQTKLSVGAINDPLEREADRVAAQVLAMPAHPAASGSSPRIQRCTGRAVGQADMVPVSVERVLAGPGSPLNPALRHDMEQRFGHDFSHVRIFAGAAAERSAAEVNAQAYTVGDRIVFGAGRFAPGSCEGQRLIAHELTHVVQQQGGQGAVQRVPAAGTPSAGVTISGVDIKSSDPDCQYQKGEVEKSRSAQGILNFDIERGEFLGIEPADAVVIADFRVDDGELRASTESLFRKYWLPTFDKSSMSSLEIIGFNDCVGWESRNQQLRQQRAQAVARLLPGIPAAAAPFGEYPVANSSERGRALNRSVIIKPKIKPSPPPPPRKREETITMQEPDTKNCSTEQRHQLSIAFPAAKLMAARALKEISSGNRGPVFTLLLERYFGPDALSHLPEIRAGFAKILANWTDWDSRFDCETQTEGACPNDDPHKVTLAYIKKKRRIFSPNQAFGTVHVCAEAFNTPGNMQQLSATVLHELSHRLDNTSDKKYCEEHVGWCSSLSAKAAIDNADSYAQFAREIFNARL